MNSVLLMQNEANSASLRDGTPETLHTQEREMSCRRLAARLQSAGHDEVLAPDEVQRRAGLITISECFALTCRDQPA